MNNSLKEMIQRTRSGKDAKRSIDRIESLTLAQNLKIMRIRAGLSQAELAVKMGVNQPKVARLEKTAFNDFKIGDVDAYAKAVGHHLELGVGTEIGLGQMMKMKTAQLVQLGREINDMCAGDKTMEQGLLVSVISNISLQLGEVEKYLPAKLRDHIWKDSLAPDEVLTEA
jgi:predicted XRE-type DNA-binding protein